VKGSPSGHTNTHMHLVLDIWDGLFYIMDIPTGHKPETKAIDIMSSCKSVFMQIRVDVRFC